MINQESVIVPTIFSRADGLITSGMSTRVGSISPGTFAMNLSYRVGDDEASVRANRAAFFGALGGTEETTAFAAQCHSDVIRRAEGGGIAPDCDALATGISGIGLAVSVADCVPVLIGSMNGACVSAVHSGWRGTVKEIVARSLQFLSTVWGVAPSDLLVWVGPSAGVCCYEVGGEVAGHFPQSSTRIVGGRHFVDLKSANVKQTRAHGIPASNIEVDDRCTICGIETFHSFRRDGAASGRMLAYIRKNGMNAEGA